jgi:uncharacterized protein (TIGR02145 family)
MRKFLLASTVLICLILSVRGQSKKTSELFIEGIESNDLVKIAAALSAGAQVDLGLRMAIEKNNQNLANYFVDRGGKPSRGLDWAVRQDKIDMVKLMLEKGGRFENDTIVDFYYIEFLPAGAATGVPVTYVRGTWKMKDEQNNVLIPVDLRPGYRFGYAAKSFSIGNNALIYAIRNRNIEVVKLLIDNGVDPRELCMIRYSTVQGIFRGASGSIVTNEYLKPALIMKPVEFALLMGADKEIVDLLLATDNIPDTYFNFDQVVYEGDDENITNVNVQPFDNGVSITFDANVDKIFGVTLLCSKNNRRYQAVNRYPEQNKYENALKSTYNKITFYYSSVFKNDSLPGKLSMMLAPKEYLIDSRDSQKYRTLKIGKMEIMTENFRYKAEEGCWAYKNDESNVPKRGYLYNWETANKIAPNGWHLPSKDEWEAIYAYLKGFPENINEVTEPGGYSGLNFEWNGYKDFKTGFAGGKDNVNTLASLWSSTPDGERAAQHFLLWKIGRPLECRWAFKASAMGVRFIKD